MTEQDKDEAARWARMVDAEERAFALLDAVEVAGIMKPGRTEGEVDRDIEAIAAEQFGIARNWHQRLVRAGPNTTCIFSDMPDEVTIGAEDTVYVDMGPVFEQAEADVGRTYAMGQDPARRALVAALPDVFEEMRAFTLSKRGCDGGGGL
jgi:Xaa-Pro dipeptidase